MMLNWAEFTPISAAIGGIFIGIAVMVFILFSGRIAGISGILANALTLHSGSGWRIAFIAGLMITPWLYSFFVSEPLVTIAAGYPLIIIAGLLVGLGTRMANGCTSGHGICGLARLSKRSLIAVMVFMVSAFFTVWMMRHALV